MFFILFGKLSFFYSAVQVSLLLVIDVANVWLRRWAIRMLEEERNNFMNDLNVAMNKSKLKEDNKYIAKFASLIHSIKQNEIELNEHRQIETEVEKEIVQLEGERTKLAFQTMKKKKPKLIFVS